MSLDLRFNTDSTTTQTLGQMKRNNVYKMPGCRLRNGNSGYYNISRKQHLGLQKKVNRTYEKDMKLRIYTLEF